MPRILTIIFIGLIVCIKTIVSGCCVLSGPKTKSHCLISVLGFLGLAISVREFASPILQIIHIQCTVFYSIFMVYEQHFSGKGLIRMDFHLL
jgi:uncharacterized membrane protein HdeD (DUF308 family)